MAQGQSEDGSVYDFLYVDAARIAWFLAQFGKYGNLASLTHSVGKTMSGGGSIGLAATKVEGEAVSQTTQISEYNAQWLAPLTLLDELQQRKMIVRGVGTARIGQLVLATGALAILDLSTLKSLWDMPPIQKMIAQGMSAQVAIGGDRNTQSKAAQQQLNAVKAIIDVLKVLPHGIQARLGTEAQEMVWCGLNEGSLIGSSADLMLKHGAVISGIWSILGILDAVPDAKAEQTNPTLVADLQNEIAQMVATLGPLARSALGRPAGSYGMTPLLIFREVSA